MTATLTEGASLALDTYIVDLAWSPDGSSIAIAGGEGAVVLVENVTQKLTSRVIGEHGMGVIAVKWQPGGGLLASSGQDSAVVLWNVSSGAPTTGEPEAASVAQRIRPGTAWSEHIAFCADGKLLAVATGKVLTPWNSAGEKVHQFEPLAGNIAAIEWDKPGRDLAAATAGAVSVHRVEPPQFSARNYSWPAACLTAAYSPNGKVLASGMQDGSVHFWHLATGKDSQMRGYGSKVTLTQWSSSSRYLATAAGPEVVVWDFAGKGPEGSAPLELTGHTERITHLAWQGDGPYLLSVGRDWRLSLWQPGKEKQALDAHLCDGEVTAVQWSPDGKRVAVGGAKASSRFTS